MRNNPFIKFLTKEDFAQKAVINFLSMQYPDSLFFHVANEGKRTPFERFKFSWLGARKGVADIIILEQNKKYAGLIIEMKSETGKPTLEQVKFIDDCQKRGYYATISYGSEYAIEIIQKYFRNKL